MIHRSQAALGATASWADLAQELDRWGDQGRIATLWWRDDDAAAPCGQLDRLLEIAGTVPVALAVIPAAAEAGLAARLGGLGARSAGSPPFEPPPIVPPGVTILQHGWRHSNHATRSAKSGSPSNKSEFRIKKSEFPAERSPQSVTAELRAGRARLMTLFGTRALAVLAPPWNRFDEGFLPLLGECGIAAVSRLGPRRAARPSPGVFEANVQVDLVAWKRDRGFVGETAALAGLVGHLRARRTGAADGAEPSGILTHHLVQDEATGAFLGRLVALTAAHPAARWLTASEVFAPALGATAGGEIFAPAAEPSAPAGSGDDAPP
jgi:hypothetical protein